MRNKHICYLKWQLRNRRNLTLKLRTSTKVLLCGERLATIHPLIQELSIRRFFRMWPISQFRNFRFRINDPSHLQLIIANQKPVTDFSLFKKSFWNELGSIPHSLDALAKTDRTSKGLFFFIRTSSFCSKTLISSTAFLNSRVASCMCLAMIAGREDRLGLSTGIPELNHNVQLWWTFVTISS